MRLHGERFGLYRGARRRVLTVGALVLALSASVVPAVAASPSPSGSPPTAASGAPSPSSSPKSPSLPATSPSSGATAQPAPKPSAKSAAPKAAAAGAASTSNAVYAYDAAGRLVGLTDPAGETARYRYDPAGNRLGIDRFPSSQLSVLSLVPVRAAAGARVTLSGTGFSTTVASNAVSFGGTAATVVSATATRLVVTVPAGAKAGTVSVTVAGASAQSVEAFALATPAPVLSSFAPASAVAGAQVVISGSGFAATATDNVVRFNGRVARVVSASATSLTVEVPPGAADGLIEVATRDGRGASAGNFSVVGSGGPVYDSVVTTTVSDANPPSVAVTTPGHLGEVLFDAEQGDDMSFGFTASTFNTGLTLKLLDPRGTQVDSRSLSSSGGDWDVRNLPLAGRYSLIVDPGSNNIGAATVTLSNPVGGALSLTGPSVAAQVNRPGQNGRWTLSAQAGQSLSVGFAVSAMTAGKSVDARLYGPDGAEVAGSYRLLSPNSTDSLDIDALPQTGTYTVVANPVDGATGTMTATGSLYADAGTLDPAGAAVDLKIDRAGQNGWARFTGSVGQRLSLGVSSTGFTSYVPVEVRDPAGNRIDSFTVQTNSATQWDGPQLTTSGTYTLAVAPNYAGTGSLSLMLSAPLTVGPLTTTAAATAVQIARTGQDAEATFSAQAGDNLSLGITSNTFPQSLSVSVIAPSGKKVVDRAYIGSGNTDSIGLPGVPESGTYTVVIDPYQGATGALNLTLSADATAAPVLDGAQAAGTVARPGQRLRVEFTAPAGGAVGFGVTGNSLSQMAEVRLVDATGGTGTYVDWVSASSPNASYLTGLTAGAKYALVLTPSSAGTGGLTAWLSSPVQAGQLTTAAPAQQGQVTRPGQQLDYTLPITAGEGDVVTFDANSLTQASNLVLLGPDGTALGSTGFLNGAGTGKLNLRAPLAAGTYHVLVRPQRPTSGNVTATRLADVDGGTLTAGGGKKPAVITTAGQNAHYTFTGSAGQQLTLALDAPATNWNLSVYGPNGQWLIDTRYMSTSDTSLALPALPVAGTYTLTVDPGAMATGTFNLGLTAAAGLAAKAPAAQKATTAVQSAKPTADKATTATAGVVPSGADAWQPSQQNLAGRDWLTGKGATPRTPPALRGPPSQTALTGQVLKLDGAPLSKVAVRIGTKSGHTDEQGRFLLAGISTQDTTLVVDGTTANTKDRSYGRFDIHIQPKAGQTSELGFPVWMTPLDTKHTVHFDAPAKSEVVLKTPQIPGLEVRIPKGSVVRDEKGKPVTELGITPIALDRAPFPLPAHSVVPVFFTVQPGGTYIFPKGAQVIYPNYTHEPPGTRVEFMDYDPKAKGWYVYGHGQVSRDGRQVVPDATTRVWAFHGAMFNVSDLVPWDLSWIKDAFNWLSGDPVDLGTGMLTDSRTDLAVTDPLGGAEVARTYWQGDTHQRAFGIGRDLSYNVLLHSEKQYQEVDLYLPGGAKVHFTRTSPGTSYSDAVFEPTDTPSEFKGSKIVNANGQWELRFRDGAVWVFPEYALLKQIRDRHGNTLDITRLNGTKGEVTQVTTSGGRWITFGYDAQHRVTSARDNTGRTVSYTYDTAGRLSTVTDPAGKASSYTYDGTTNRIATATDARGIVYMSNTFDTAGRVKVQTLTEGATYSFAYTQTGTGPITATEVTQPGGAIRRVEFDTNGYGITDTAAYNSPSARKTTYTRGTSHRVDSVTDPYGRRTDLTYDANGYVTQSTEQAGTANARTSGTAVFDGPFDQPSKVTDPLGNTTLLAYFDNGDLKTVTDPEGRQTAYTYQPDGQVKTVTDAAGAATNYAYLLGELQSVTDANNHTSTQFLDAAGRPSALTDTAGSATTMVYDVLNQTRQVTDPLGNTTGFGYDDNGNLTTLTDARNNTTTWGYDDADRPKTATDPLGAQASFEYDAAGLLHRATSRSGQVAISDHDLLGRTTQVRYGVNVLGQAESTATYDYAGTGNLDLLQKITDSQAGTQSFTYDAYDRTKTVTGPTGTVGYDYDGADRRTTMTAGGITTTYGYDKSSILTSLTAGAQQVNFGLDAVGREHTATLPGGFTRTTDTDNTGTVKAITYAQGTKTIGDLAYTRDERGLQSGLTGSLANTALPAAETGAAFGKDNRITTFNGRSFTYDADGQLKDDGQRTYTWNARGQLAGLAKSGVNSAFGYDPLGTRTAKTTGGTTGKFLTDGSNPAVEQDGSGGTTATVTTSGLDQYLTRTENGATQIYLTDALGTVLGLANADGTIATKYTYDPGGQPTTTGATSTNPYTFTGRENDGTGLLYYRDRYYDPQTGRFISQDPSGQAGGTNLYQYALSSPTTYSDPTGNNPMLAACAVNGLLDGGLDWLTQRLSGRKVSWGQVGNAALTGCMMGMAGEVFGMFLEARGGLRAASCMANSFTADTPVLMADGTHKPIKDIHIGDKVAATDPETGETGPRTVTALIQGTGDKQLIDITTTDSTGKPGHLTATDGHPFWVPDIHKWVPAGKLKAGQWLQTSTGTWTQVSAVQHRSQTTTVYNLTVDDLHTYYVLAGATPVLVHNCGPEIAEGARASKNPAELPDIFDPSRGEYNNTPKLPGAWESEEGAARREAAKVADDGFDRRSNVGSAPGIAGKMIDGPQHPGAHGPAEVLVVGAIVTFRGWQRVRKWFR